MTVKLCFWESSFLRPAANRGASILSAQLRREAGYAPSLVCKYHVSPHRLQNSETIHKDNANMCIVTTLFSSREGHCCLRAGLWPIQAVRVGKPSRIQALGSRNNVRHRCLYVLELGQKWFLEPDAQPKKVGLAGSTAPCHRYILSLPSSSCQFTQPYVAPKSYPISSTWLLGFYTPICIFLTHAMQ